MNNKNNEIFTKECSKCNEEFRTKHITRGYCNSCYSEYQRTYREEHKDGGYYLYIVTNDKEVLYVGATEDIHYRIEQQHLKGHSHIKELMLSNNWTCIKYLDITNLVSNREEMLLLENSLIELYNTDYNEKKNIIRNIDKLIEFQLISEIHSLTQNWITYCKNENKKNAFINACGDHL